MFDQLIGCYRCGYKRGQRQATYLIQLVPCLIDGRFCKAASFTGLVVIQCFSCEVTPFFSNVYPIAFSYVDGNRSKRKGDSQSNEIESTSRMWGRSGSLLRPTSLLLLLRKKWTLTVKSQERVLHIKKLLAEVGEVLHLRATCFQPILTPKKSRVALGMLNIS